MIDETCVTTILARHFPMARREDIADAARDVVLLELLADDRAVIWEDAMRNRQDPGLVRSFAPEHRPDS